jgi:hypothetical protein
MLTQTVVARRGHQGPDRRILRHGGQLGAVAAVGVVPPLANLGEIANEGRRNIFELIEPMQAQVVGAAFQERRADGPAYRFADQRQVPVIELVLKRLGSGADDGLAATHQGGQQVRESLAATASAIHAWPARGWNPDSIFLRGLCSPKKSGKLVTADRVHASTPHWVSH